MNIARQSERTYMVAYVARASGVLAVIIGAFVALGTPSGGNCRRRLLILRWSLALAKPGKCNRCAVAADLYHHGFARYLLFSGGMLATMLPVIAVFFAAQRLFIDGITLIALKGWRDFWALDAASQSRAVT